MKYGGLLIAILVIIKPEYEPMQYYLLLVVHLRDIKWFCTHISIINVYLLMLNQFKVQVIRKKEVCVGINFPLNTQLVVNPHLISII